jgi:hypothetical protein
MIRNIFSKDTLSVSVYRIQEDKIRLSIASDYSGSSRKSRLSVNEVRLAKDVEDFWKSIKTKKLKSMSVSFDEIDWYDDMTDMYDTPIIRIQRGLKRAKVSHRDHGSIPKDWGVALTCLFDDTTTNTPILEVVKSAVGSYMNSQEENEFIKALKPFLQKKTQVASWEVEYEY